MLLVEHATKAYGTGRALDDVSVRFEPGRIHVLLGSSGSGKSTLLRAALGLVRLDEGVIEFEGTDVARSCPEMRAARVGYVPQDSGLFPHLSAQRNVTMVARARGWPMERITRRLAELNEVLPVESDWLNRRPRDLSGGQRQRIALHRALFLDPPLILMDEPFGALDPIVRADVQDEFKSLIKALGKTVVFVTHDVGEAAFLGDAIVLMHAGRVMQTGTFDDLLSRPATPFVRAFLAAQRFLRGTV